MDISLQEASRIRETLEMIPPDIATILEVGCGDGRIINSLSRKYRVVGADIDRERIKSVCASKMIVDVSRLPVRKNTFDLVLAAEILEHLPQETLDGALEEIRRSAAKYVLVTVPFKEALSAQWVKCSRCGRIFNAWGHVRSFNMRILKGLFPGMRLIEQKRFAVKEARIPFTLYAFAKRFGNAWDYNGQVSCACPQCGAPPVQSEGTLLGRILTRIIWRFQRISPFRKPVWIGCLYKKYGRTAPE